MTLGLPVLITSVVPEILSFEIALNAQMIIDPKISILVNGNIRKITSRVAGVAPRFSRKPHPATLPQTKVGTLNLRWRFTHHNHLWHHKWCHKFTIIYHNFIIGPQSQFLSYWTTLYSCQNLCLV